MSDSQLIAPTHPPIAVVGVGALFPGSQEPTGFWRDVIGGRDLIRDVPAHYWLTQDFYDPDPFAPDKTYANRGAFLSKIDFDPMYFGIPPKNVPHTDTSQLLALVVARQVLEDLAGGPFDHIDRERMSCIIGVAAGLELLGEMAGRLQRPLLVKTMREMGMPEDLVQEVCERVARHGTQWSEATFPGLLGNVVAGRIANRFDLGGMNCTTDAACASSFSALALALDELYLGNSDVVITGGVDTCQDPFLFTCFSKTPALSLTGDVRPFSEKADGTMLGEGIGMVALKRLADAERDGDAIYAIIRGLGSSSDGRAKSIYAPLASGQARALGRAYSNAGVAPATVELMEAHGTATQAGDAAEVGGMRQVFDPSRPEHQFCALGSIKSQLGHTKSAAGAASLLKIVFSLQHRTLPPTLKVERPNPKLGLPDSAFYINTQTRPWVRDDAHPRRAGISSFGFGGTNYHCVLEEYTGPGRRAARRRTSPTELVLFGAPSTQDLLTRVDGVLADLAALPALDPELGERADLLRALAHSTQHQVHPSAPVRLAVVASSNADLAQKLEQVATSVRKDGTKPFSMPGAWYAATPATPGKVAFLFSGQGSQYLRMGGDVAMAFPSALDIWDRAATLLRDGGDGRGIHDVVFPRPVFDDGERAAQKATLTSTEWAQPALGLTSAALYSVLEAAGVRPDCVAGHSFGEVTALYAAGVLDFESFLTVARARGELMGAAAGTTPGSMTAVRASAGAVREALAGFDAERQGIVIANDNAPIQVVLSGPTAGIEAAEAHLTGKGLRCTRLAVATAFHSPLVAPSTIPFAERLARVELGEARIPVYANSTAAPYPRDGARTRELMAGQIAQPVRFVEMIRAMVADGVRTFVEVGAGSVLDGLASACSKDLPEGAEIVSVSLDGTNKHGLTALWHGLGRLAVHGVSIDFAALWAGYETPVDPRTIKAPVLSLKLDGQNYQRDYPPPGGAAFLPKPNPPSQDPGVWTTAPSSLPPLPQRKTNKALAAKIAAARSDTAGGPATSGSSAAPPAATAAPTPKASAGGNGKAALRADAPAAVPKRTNGSLGVATPSAGAPRPTDASSAGATGNGPTAAPGAARPAATSSVAATAKGTGPGAGPGAPRPAATSSVAAAGNRPTATPSAAAQFVAQTAAAGAPVQTTAVTPVAAAPIHAQAQAPFELYGSEAGHWMSPTWLQAFQAVQHQTADLHIGYQRSMADAHVAFLEAAQSTTLGMTALVTGQPLPAPPARSFDGRSFDGMRLEPASLEPASYGAPASPTVEQPEAAFAPAAVQAYAPAIPAVQAHVPAAPAVQAHAPAVPAVQAHAPAVPAVQAHAPAASGRAHAPAAPAVQARASAVPAVQAHAPGTVHAPAAATVKAPVPARAPAAPAGLASPADSSAARGLTDSPGLQKLLNADLRAMLFDVVADKTGYPKEVLSLEMGLEADLGIDSIKRVEILSAIQDEIPDLPEVDASEMAQLQTLGQVLGYMETVRNHVANGTIDAWLAERAARGQSAEPPQALPAAPPAAVKGTPAAPASVAAPAPATEPAPGPGVTTTLLRHAVEEIPAEPAGFALPGLRPGALVHITDDGNGVAAALAARLTARGMRALTVAEPTGEADAVVFLGGLRDVANEQEALAVCRAAFDAARAVAAAMTERGGTFVTVQDTGGDFGLRGTSPERAAIGGLPGLVKSARFEWLRCGTKAIDLERGTRSTGELADALAAELLYGGAQVEVGLHADGRRTTLVTRPAPVELDAPPLDRDSVLVVSGGARGVTAACVIELARVYQPRVALLGRTPLADEPACVAGAGTDAEINRALLADAAARGERLSPAQLRPITHGILRNREVRATLAALAEAGSEARYVPVSVTDGAAVSAALDEVRAAWGPVTALIHGAGVLHDKLIADKTAEQYEDVVHTKVGGLRALLDATAGDPLRLIAMFSSVAGRMGNRGQSDYAMANEMLNKIAATEAVRRGPGTLVRSINWGAWEGGMVTPALEKQARKMGVPLIPLRGGAAALAAELGCRAPGGSDTGGSHGVGVEIVIEAATPDGEAFVDPGKLDLSMGLWIDKGSHPYLESHAIDDVPVVPVVMVLEWFTRAALAANPGLSVVACRDLRVLKGIRLESFEHGHTVFDLTSKPVANGAHRTLEMELRGPGGMLHYRAAVELAHRDANQRRPLPNPEPKLGPWPWSSDEAYADKLFHRNAFRVIRSLEGVSREAGVGTLAGAAEMGWPASDWKTDPAALDGGLQLARLWGTYMTGKLTLPTRVEEYVMYTHGLFEGPVRCTVVGREVTNHRTKLDVAFATGDGRLAAEMRGVEMHMLPS